MTHILHLKTLVCLLGHETKGKSIVDCVLDTVMKSPVDVRAALLDNILLLGGTAMLPGKSRFCFT